MPPVDDFGDVMSGEWRVAGGRDDDAQHLPQLERQIYLPRKVRELLLDRRWDIWSRYFAAAAIGFDRDSLG